MSASDGDWAIWHESKIEAVLHRLFQGVSKDEEPLIFGDPAYKGAYGVIGPYIRRPGRPLTAEEIDFNCTMSTIRISIEHLFGRVLNLCALDGHKYSRQIGNQPVAAYYMVAVLLTNIRTCLGDCGNQVSSFFACPPPTLREYLGSVSRADGDIIDEDIM